MRLVLLLLAVGVTIYAVVDCARSRDDEIRGLPKALWLVVILLLFPPIGGLLYITLGRAPAPDAPGGRNRPKMLAPDDDPEFLRTLRVERGSREPGGQAADPRPPHDGERRDDGRRGGRPDGKRPGGSRRDQDGDDHSDHPAS
jgi:hypothetical protein